MSQEGGETVTLGNADAEKLYEACYMKVFSYVMTLTGDQLQAEEITQETFFRAISKRNSFRGEADEVTWLCAIARNCFLDEKRRQAKHVPLEEDLPASGFEEEVSDHATSFRIHRVLHSMEDPYREVFELRIFGELSFREIGLIFNKTENWARVTFHRARLKLQERLGKNEI